MKKYLSISQVSKLIGIKEHVIRYWDSIDPNTNRYRIEGISTKSRSGTRYFNKQNISKLNKLKKVLYENGKNNNSLKIAEQLISSSKNIDKIEIIQNYNPNIALSKNHEKIDQILKKMRNLLKKSEQ